MRTHMIGENDLPHIAVIDSRTGARILTVKGFLSPGDLAMALLEFLDSNSFDDTRAPRIRNIDTTRDVDRHAAAMYADNDADADAGGGGGGGGGSFLDRLSAAADAKDGPSMSSSSSAKSLPVPRVGADGKSEGARPAVAESDLPRPKSAKHEGADGPVAPAAPKGVDYGPAPAEPPAGAF